MKLAMTSRRLVILDDHVPLAKMVEFCAQVWGWNAVWFGEVKAALEYFDEEIRIDAFLCDLQMPLLDGIQTLAYLRAAGWHGPAAIMTGKPHLVDVAAQEQYGITAILPKPFGTAELFETLDGLANLACAMSRLIAVPSNRNISLPDLS
jgi:DNA-binding response OmpR family regulator